MDDVRLPELNVIQRYSIAVRQEYAPAEEVIAALKADLDALSKTKRPSGSSRAPKRSSTARSRAPKRSSTARSRARR